MTEPARSAEVRKLDTLKRLQDDVDVWVSTTCADGSPYLMPLSFLWDGETLLVYSRPNTAKLRFISANPRDSLNLDGDGKGGNIVVITGTARVDEATPPADQLPAYLEKYREAIARIGMDPRRFAQDYSVPIRITPTKLSGH